MSLYPTQPHWMSDQQWEDEQAAKRAQAEAYGRGIGLLQISPRRYVVIKSTGASASKSGSGPWHAYLGFHIVDGGDNLTWQQARNLLREISAKQDADQNYQPELKVWQ
jgi:hypothetical protein